MKNPLISIVTISYNTFSTIESTILSVINQTYPNIEYIIIDGGSTDGTIDIIKKYADKISYWVSEPDKGIYDAMNKGINKATGEWIIFMNTGDKFATENVLIDMVMEITPTIDILRANIIRRYKKFDVISTGIIKQEPTIIDMINNTFHHQSTLIRRKLFIKYGLYSTKYKLCSDWKFFFDCTILHKVKSKYINYNAAIFMMGGISNTNYTQYIKEREDYLSEIYGKEIISYLYELKIYRNQFISKYQFKIRKYIASHLNKETYYNLLIAKRFIKSKLGLKVN